MIDLRHIRHFLAAATHSTVQEAADVLCITQPALTKSVARFEEELGEKLFDRAGRSLVLTELGQILVHRGEVLLRHVDEFQEEVVLWKAIGTGEVAIGVDGEVELSLLPPVLEAFVPIHPKVQVTVRSGHTDTLLPALLAGDLHFLVTDSELALEHPDLEVRPLAGDPIAAGLRSEHPLTQKRKVSPAEFMSYPVAGTFMAPRYARAMSERRLHKGTELLSASLISDNYEVLVRLVESSDTIVIGPRSVLLTYETAGRLTVMDWDLEGPRTSPSLIYSKGRNFSPAAKRLMFLFDSSAAPSEHDRENPS